MILGGSILLLLGLMSMLTPIPGGTLAIATGAGLVICASQTAADMLKNYRIKYSRLNGVITWLENKMGQRLSRPLRLTRPEKHELPK